MQHLCFVSFHLILMLYGAVELGFKLLILNAVLDGKL